MIRGILLDIDGTLVLSNDAHAHAWVEAFAQYGYQVDFNQVRPLIGMGGDKLLAKLQPGLSDTEGDGQKITEARSQLFLGKYVSQLKPTPGARQLLEAFRATGHKLIAASSSKKDELSALLDIAGVADILTEATTSDDAEESKPAPDIVQVALQKIGLPPEEVCMLGDTPYDITAATRAGVFCLAVRCGGWSDTDLDGAREIFNDPLDLLEHLPDYLR